MKGVNVGQWSPRNTRVLWLHRFSIGEDGNLGGANAWTPKSGGWTNFRVALQSLFHSESLERSLKIFNFVSDLKAKSPESKVWTVWTPASSILWLGTGTPSANRPEWADRWTCWTCWTSKTWWVHGVFCRFHLSVFIHIHTILSVSQFTPILSVFARCVFALSMNVWSFARGRCPSSGRSGPENQHKTNTCFPPCLQQTISIENHVWNQLGCEVQGLGQPGAGTEDALGIVQCTSWNTNNPRNIYIILYIMYTSSTAQGGGGSFKNRKPIGEIGCCESGMAEQIHWWTERCLRSPLFLSLSLTIYPPTNLSSMHLSIYRSIYPSLSLYLSFI